jgi:hypothetical protein
LLVAAIKVDILRASRAKNGLRIEIWIGSWDVFAPRGAEPSLWAPPWMAHVILRSVFMPEAILPAAALANRSLNYHGTVILKT